MSKKQREVKKRKKLEDKANSERFRKKIKYKKMADNGILGTKELSKYNKMYIHLKRNTEGDFSFPAIGSKEAPTRYHYEQMHIMYNKNNYNN